MTPNVEKLYRLQELQRTVGALGPRLRRCKPGSPRHQEIWDALTKAENEASNISSELRMVLEGMLPL